MGERVTTATNSWLLKYIFSESKVVAKVAIASPVANRMEPETWKLISYENGSVKSEQYYVRRFQ